MGGSTTREIWVEWLMPPPLPITVTAYEPVGVADEVVIVSELVNVGDPEGGRKEHEAPEGSPLEHERLTDEKGPPCLLYTSPSPRDLSTSRMPSSA